MHPDTLPHSLHAGLGEVKISVMCLYDRQKDLEHTPIRLASDESASISATRIGPTTVNSESVVSASVSSSIESAVQSALVGHVTKPVTVVPMASLRNCASSEIDVMSAKTDPVGKQMVLGREACDRATAASVKVVKR